MAEISLFNLVLIAVIASGIWYFFDAMRARELATAVVREYCKQSSLQFLDGTVGLKTVTLSFEGGKLRLRRRYEFHYSESDHSRSIGLVTINGIKVENFILPKQILQPGNSTLKA